MATDTVAPPATRPRPAPTRGKARAVGVAAAVTMFAAAGAGAWALGRGGGEPPAGDVAIELEAPEILEPQPGSDVAVGTPVQVRFSGAVPDGVEARLYVNGEEVLAPLEGTTFTHAFTDVGNQSLVVRLVDVDGKSYDSADVELATR